MNLSQVPRKISDSVVTRKIDNELLVVDQENDKIHQFNRSAAFIWDHCDGQNSVNDIIKVTLDKFEANEVQVSEDVTAILENLISLNLIELESA